MYKGELMLDLKGLGVDDFARLLEGNSCTRWCAKRNHPDCPNWHSKPPLGDCRGFVPNEAALAQAESLLVNRG